MIELFAQARFQTSIRAFEVLTPPNPDYVQLIHTLDVPSLLITGDVGAVVLGEGSPQDAMYPPWVCAKITMHATDTNAITLATRVHTCASGVT